MWGSMLGCGEVKINVGKCVEAWGEVRKGWGGEEKCERGVKVCWESEKNCVGVWESVLGCGGSKLFLLPHTPIHFPLPYLGR